MNGVQSWETRGMRGALRLTLHDEQHSEAPVGCLQFGYYQDFSFPLGTLIFCRISCFKLELRAVP